MSNVINIRVGAHAKYRSGESGIILWADEKWVLVSPGENHAPQLWLRDSVEWVEKEAAPAVPDLTLVERVKCRVRDGVLREQEHRNQGIASDYAIDCRVEEAINDFTISQLLDAISLELEEKEAGG